MTDPQRASHASVTNLIKNNINSQSSTAFFFFLLRPVTCVLIPVNHIKKTRTVVRK